MLLKFYQWEVTWSTTPLSVASFLKTASAMGDLQIFPVFKNTKSRQPFNVLLALHTHGTTYVKVAKCKICICYAGSWHLTHPASTASGLPVLFPFFLLKKKKQQKLCCIIYYSLCILCLLFLYIRFCLSPSLFYSSCPISLYLKALFKLTELHCNVT